MMNNNFSYDYFRKFVNYAKEKKYDFYTVADYLTLGCPSNAFVLKHDLDTKPRSLEPLLNIERELGIRTTIYVRVANSDYNPLAYDVMPTLLKADHDGFEIGLHTNFYEYSILNGIEPMNVLEAETNLLRSFFPLMGMSTHRDFNYAYNALPFVEANWDLIKNQCGFNYQAYDKRLMESCTYVNEGTKPHLTWRDLSPVEAIETGKNIYMLTHPHWWFDKNPFMIW